MEIKTHFASPQRSTNEEVLQDNNLIKSQELFGEVFNTFSGISAIVNGNRQIVYSNEEFLGMLGLDDLGSVMGKRPGEAVACIHAGEEPGGCGTSPSCAYCGAVQAVLDSQKTGLKSSKETRLTTVNDGKSVSWDLNITSAPVTISGKKFYVVTFQDISDEKRRSALERTFFHDLLNTAGGLNGILSMLKEGVTPEEEDELIILSEEASRDLIDEINLHRQIRAAETGDLKVNIEKAGSLEIMQSSIGRISFHEVGKGRKITLSKDSVDVEFNTDRVVFQRVIINLLKNALEATHKEGVVEAGVKQSGSTLSFWVKNDVVIPKDIQMQLFQRSFSTKGQSRGIGTYSIKLLTENYLNGKVSFISNETDGTVFTIEFTL